MFLPKRIVWPLGNGSSSKGGMTQKTIADRIIEEIALSPGCLLEDLAFKFPDLTWNQIFTTVDRLSRTGQLLLTRKGEGAYSLRLPDK